jgi:hypothetical protein
MNTLRPFVQLSLVIVALTGPAAWAAVNESPSQSPIDSNNLLDNNPRLRQLITEANRASGPEEIEYLTRAGVNSDVVQKFVETSSRLYSLDAEEIIKLHKQGVASSVITAMIQKRRNSETTSAVESVAPAQTVGAPVMVQPQPQASEPASSVIYVPNSPRPVRYPDRPLYLSAYSYASWSPAYYGGYGCYSYYPGYCYRPGYWNYRPTWSYDFRSYGCW